jgi:hypothetical protein
MAGYKCGWGQKHRYCRSDIAAKLEKLGKSKKYKIFAKKEYRCTEPLRGQKFSNKQQDR